MALDNLKKESGDISMKALLAKAGQILTDAHVADAEIDSWLLMEEVFHITRATYYVRPDQPVSEPDAARYLALVRQRAEHIPLQHLTGVQEFMGMAFQVNEDVLIPRQDTELLVETAAVDIRSRGENVRVLDMCTGSGCIAIALKKLCPQAEVVAADISVAALAVARQNGEQNETQVTWVQSDLFAQIAGSFDVIVSNPPYICSAEVDTLMPEVRDHEPRLALDGDTDGLKFYRSIIAALEQYLKPGGAIFFEIGYDQGQSVPALLEQHGLHNIAVLKDLSGLDRVVKAGKEEYV